MPSPLSLLADPFVVVGLALLIFTARVIVLAKRLRFAAHSPMLEDIRALEEAKKSLHAHKDSLEAAKEAMAGNLEGARDTLRHYRAPLRAARSEKEAALGKAMKQKAFKDAKKLSQAGRPRKRRRPSVEAPKDI